jgi:glycosyltransferase involved in cell wall biosynthesis/SAM-dependent methyltransferase
MPDPEVSVVVPFFNAGRFLEECIASVVAQTYTSWELVLVDDGSTDRGTGVARAHVARDPSRVRYFQHPGRERRGASAARNLGIQRARGRYVAFLDADDVWLPGKLAAQVAILEAHPQAAMAYNRTQFWYSWTGDVEDRRRDRMERLGVAPDTLITPPTLLTLILREASPVPCTCSVLIRRDAVERVGGFEERFFDVFTDQAFYAKVFFHLPVFAADGCWDRYRQHPDQSCVAAERTGRISRARLAFLEWLERYLIDHQARGTDVWHALQHALEPYRRPTNRRDALTRWLRPVATRVLPAPAQDWLRRRWRGRAYTPPVGRIRFGDLRRTTPVTRTWGYERGLPVDRYYIEQFLARHAGDVRGSVLEVGDDRYTVRFGFPNVISSDVLNVAAGDPQTTIVADLSRAEQLPADRFDCVIITQTLQLIDDLRSAIGGLHRMLRPGGVVLATLPGISQTHHGDWGAHWRWNFTALSARTLFESAFAPGDVTVETRGNVLTAVAFLHGLAAEDLRRDELDHDDPDYQVSILVRAMKAGR